MDGKAKGDTKGCSPGFISLVRTGLGGRARSPKFPDSLAMHSEVEGVTLPPLSLLRPSADRRRRERGGRVTPVLGAAIQENRESRSDSESCPSYLGL